MNLYDKIYKAVNEGIQKALLIDPDQSDVSINYSYHKIDNKSNLLPYYVNDLSNTEDLKERLDIYDKIIDIYKTNKMYIVKNIHELNDIFNNLYFITALKNFNSKYDKLRLDWIDTTNALSFIMKNNSELLLHEINDSNFKKIKFIKFKNIDYCNHPIIIHKDLKIKNHLWLSKKVDENQYYKNFDNSSCIQKNDLLYDFNGYQHTYNNINIPNNDFSNYPGFTYIIKQSDNNYDAYMPAIGELIFLSRIQFLISYLLRLINPDEITPFENRWYKVESTIASSSEPSAPWIAYLSKTVMSSLRSDNMQELKNYYPVETALKQMSHGILPLYKNKRD